MNSNGFLTPYRGERYHLSEWGPRARPSTPREFFNMKHSRARNVIEREFGLSKGRWAILRGKSYYPVKTQGRIITACCLLQNHIQKEMAVDPMKEEIEDLESNYDHLFEDNLITHVEANDDWSQKRDNHAQEMFNRWRGEHN
ncbi:protein ALP1-like [Senna tora]|uniref:Protein ALP1-like n=1 Tax=Senna tora TaxID=362788 RepID=A0A835CGF1_9FABA|nr:protein ALP1-like [Senna tora]